MRLRLDVSPEKVTRHLLFVIGVLILLSSLTQIVVHATGHDVVFGLVPLFYVDSESNIPTLFSVLLLCTSCVLVGVAWREARAKRAKHANKWFVLSTGFALMAIDEFTSLHERLTAPIRHLAADVSGGFLYYGWVAAGAIVVALLGVYFLTFLRDLPEKDRNRFLAAGATYLGGALIVESLGGRLAMAYGQESVTHSISATVEESLEMLGLVLFIRAILHRFAVPSGRLSVEFGAAEAESAS